MDSGPLQVSFWGVACDHRRTGTVLTHVLLAFSISICFLFYSLVGKYGNSMCVTPSESSACCDKIYQCYANKYDRGTYFMQQSQTISVILLPFWNIYTQMLWIYVRSKNMNGTSTAYVLESKTQTTFSVLLNVCITVCSTNVASRAHVALVNNFVISMFRTDVCVK